MAGGAGTFAVGGAFGAAGCRGGAGSVGLRGPGGVAPLVRPLFCALLHSPASYVAGLPSGGVFGVPGIGFS